MLVGVDAVPGRLDAVERDLGIVLEERAEHADRVRAAADARDGRVDGDACRGALRERLVADHALELGDEGRIRVRAGRASDAVVSRSDVRHPVAERFVHRVFQRARAARDGHDARAEHLHARDVRRLARDVELALVDLAR